MIHANLHISAETKVIWGKSDSGKTFWVELTENGTTFTIFVEGIKDAKALVSLLWRIRQHNDPEGMERKYGASIAKLVSQGVSS